MTETAEPIIAPAGLKNVVVADTELGDVRGAEGRFHYRQYDAVDLARTRQFEEVAHLMLMGHLPSAAELTTFTARWRAAQQLPDVVAAALPVIARSGGERAGMARFRTAVSLLGSVDDLAPGWGSDADTVRDQVLRIAALTPVLQAALHRLRHGLPLLEPRDDLGAAASWLWLTTGEIHSQERVSAINRYLVATIDHGFSASAFTARVIASAGSDAAAALCGAIGAFAGPLHGGAPDRALDALDEIGRPERVRDWVRETVAAGGRIMGFGHAVYRTADPRAVLMRETALGLGGPLASFATKVETEVIAALAELKPHAELHANVEYYAGVVMELCGLPRALFTPTFAVARVVGWGAHVLEQHRSTKIIRPIARYVGPAPTTAPTYGDSTRNPFLSRPFGSISTEP